MMKDLIRKMTGALPDWLNPVYVKELRQTLHSKSFLVVSILIVLTELLMWNSAREQLANGIWKTEDFAGTLLYALLFYVWLLGSVAFLQPAISRWIEERNLDAVSPERTTAKRHLRRQRQRSHPTGTTSNTHPYRSADCKSSLNRLQTGLHRQMPCRNRSTNSAQRQPGTMP